MNELDITEDLIAGRYQVTRHLGEGAMGSVYLAQDTQLHRQVALKVLRAEWVSRPEVAKRLEMECRIMAQLGPHNNIVTLFDRVNHGDNVVLVMEYVPGENVAAVLDRTREMNREAESSRKTTPLLAGVSTITITPDEAVNIVVQCLTGLDFAHSRGVIHRDIKPANIMVSHDHNGNLVAKITDFGIGKALSGADGETLPGMTALTQAHGPGPGTPAYMAPEQIDQQRFGAVGPAADLYALGVSLFEMLSLGLPFHGSYTELLHLHTNVEPPDIRKLMPGISGTLAGVVQKSMAKAQQDRYESAHRFKIELEAAARDPLPEYDEAPGEVVKRSPVPMLFAALAAICLSAGGYFYMAGNGESDAEPAETVTASEPVEAVAPAPAPAAPSGPPEAVQQARNAVGALAASQQIALASVPAEQVPQESLQANAAKEAGDTAFANQNWAEAGAKYTEAQGLYEAADSKLASLTPMTPVPQPSTPAPDSNANSGLAAYHVAKNSAEGAREEAVNTRFDGKVPASNADYSAGIKAMEEANAAEATGDYDTARTLLLQAKQRFEAAKPAPVVQKAAVRPATKPASKPTATKPAATAPATKPAPKPAAASEPAKPAKKTGGFSAKQSVVTHTKE